MTAAEARRRRWQSAEPYVASGALALVAGGMLAVMYATQHRGHWWGDDWALYIRQAEALMHGNPGRVADENTFTVTESAGAPFSPGLYPWGFPALLALAIPFVGSGVDALAVVPFLAAVAFAVAWYALARPRIGTVPALLGMIGVCMTPLLLGWTELIQSEFPFVATVLITLVGLDRLVERRALTDLAAPLWPLAVLGAASFLAFEIRREGFALTPAVTTAQLIALLAAIDPGGTRTWQVSSRERRRLLGRLALPHATALLCVIATRVLLPSVIGPSTDDVSLENVWTRRDRHLDHLAELFGIKQPQNDAPTVFGDAGFGWAVLATWLALVVAGIAVACSVNRRRDGHLVVYIVVALVLGTSFRATLSRYLVSVAPIMTLLALTAVVSLAGWRRRAIGVAAAALLLVPLTVANLHDAKQRIDQAELFADYGQVEWGAQHPDAIAMFDEVIALTRPNDIVASPKARVMVLETGRRSVQVDDYRPMPTAVTPDVVVTETGSRRVGELAADLRYREAWRNSRFVVYALAT